jgi:hypothetical protein
MDRIVRMLKLHHPDYPVHPVLFILRAVKPAHLWAGCKAHANAGSFAAECIA